LNHTHAIYFDPINRVWKGNRSELSIGSGDAGFSDNWNVYVFKPPVLQHNFFNSQPDSQQKFMIMLGVYHEMLGASGKQVTSMLSSGVPTSTVREWFMS
jgi:hypothetical protein